MKLAEALIERAELKRNNEALLTRIKDNTVAQEGDEPAESAAELLAEYEDNMSRLQWLIEHINRTNGAASFDGAVSIADAIAARDCLGTKIRAYREVWESASTQRFRYGQNEIKYVRCVNVKELQTAIDRMSKEYRELDTKLQGLNWTVELL